MIAANWLSFSDAIILCAVVAAGLKMVADYRGWTRSPALVRQENADLRERNATLEAEVRRLDHADRTKSEEIAVLREQVETLKQRDQKAVLEAVAALAFQAAEHEKLAMVRRHEQKAEHGEAMTVWEEIRDTLKQGGQ